MPGHGDAHLTPQQRAWFASLKAGLERDTGRTLAEWAEIARACPETRPRARLAWMKAEHGLAQNRASLVLNAAFPKDEGWWSPEPLAAALWADPAARAIFDAVRAAVTALPEVIVGQRKTYTAFSRKYQFAAARPAAGAVLLGLAVTPEEHPALVVPKRPVWSERLKAEARLAAAEDIAPLEGMIRSAWEQS